jgi:uncharacterized membrane protein (UPF0182 family)
MEPTLDQALQAVFGAAQPAVKKVSAPEQAQELIQARKDLERAEKSIQQGNWEDFGKAMEELRRLLGQPPKSTK